MVSVGDRKHGQSSVLIHLVAAVTHSLPKDCLRDLDAINC